MDRITLAGPAKTQFDAVVAPVEVVDETGRRLGHFVPAATVASDECPYPSQELDRMRAEQGGRSLPEVWRSRCFH